MEPARSHPPAPKPSLAKRLGLGADTRCLSIIGEAGHAWIAMGQPARARVAFEGLVSLTPDDPSGWLGLAQVALDLSEWKQAELAAAEATRRPYSTPATAALGYLLRARAAMGMKKHKDAIRYLKTVVELEPKGELGNQAKSLIDRLSESRNPGPG
ncbi:MAG: tetratricopeptide repeat protein [Phycisphaerales bacterium]